MNNKVEKIASILDGMPEYRLKKAEEIINIFLPEKDPIKELERIEKMQKVLERIVYFQNRIQTRKDMITTGLTYFPQIKAKYSREITRLENAIEKLWEYYLLTALSGDEKYVKNEYA